MSTPEMFGKEKVSSFVLWTEAPPLIDNASGCHGIARHIIRSCDTHIPIVLTPRFRRKISKSEIRRASDPAKVFFYPDSASTGIRRLCPLLADWLNLLLFILSLPFMASAIQATDSKRILALLGADGFSLWQVLALTFSGRPVDIYLVDNLEESARKNKRPLLLKLLRWLQPFCLRRCARVFTISPGFAEHLNFKFNIAASPLYLPLPVPPAKCHPYLPESDGRRSITFIGALNFLYESSLLALYDLILLWNARRMDSPLVLRIATYSNPTRFLEKIPNPSAVHIQQNVRSRELSELLHTSWAVFLPYSFADDERIMVRTSFSCKILEYFQCGRPIIVYGPKEASIPRHFLENNIPLCATSFEELEQVLEHLAEAGEFLESELSVAYYKLWKTFHSPDAFKKMLFIPQGEGPEGNSFQESMPQRG